MSKCQQKSLLLTFICDSDVNDREQGESRPVGKDAANYKCSLAKAPSRAAEWGDN